MINSLNLFAEYMREHEGLDFTVAQANSNAELRVPSLIYQVVNVKPFRGQGGSWAGLVLWQIDIYTDPMLGDLVRAYDNLLFISDAFFSWLESYPVQGVVNPQNQMINFIPHTPGDKISYVRCTHRIEQIQNREYLLKLPSVDNFFVEAFDNGNK